MEQAWSLEFPTADGCFSTWQMVHLSFGKLLTSTSPVGQGAEDATFGSAGTNQGLSCHFDSTDTALGSSQASQNQFHVPSGTPKAFQEARTAALPGNPRDYTRRLPLESDMVLPTS